MKLHKELSKNIHKLSKHFPNSEEYIKECFKKQYLRLNVGNKAYVPYYFKLCLILLPFSIISFYKNVYATITISYIFYYFLDSYHKFKISYYESERADALIDISYFISDYINRLSIDNETYIYDLSCHNKQLINKVHNFSKCAIFMKADEEYDEIKLLKELIQHIISEIWELLMVEHEENRDEVIGFIESTYFKYEDDEIEISKSQNLENILNLCRKQVSYMSFLSPTFKEIFDCVSNANDQKLDLENMKPKLFDEKLGKILKPAGFKSPDLISLWKMNKLILNLPYYKNPNTKFKQI